MTTLFPVFLKLCKGAELGFTLGFEFGFETAFGADQRLTGTGWAMVIDGTESACAGR